MVQGSVHPGGCLGRPGRRFAGHWRVRTGREREAGFGADGNGSRLPLLMVVQQVWYTPNSSGGFGGPGDGEDGDVVGLAEVLRGGGEAGCARGPPQMLGDAVEAEEF